MTVYCWICGDDFIPDEADSAACPQCDAEAQGLDDTPDVEDLLAQL